MTKKLMNRRRSEGGFVLIVVLSMLLLLTIVATLAYQRASDQHVVSVALRRQAVAQDRAIAAMQRGVAEVSQSPRPPWLTALAGSMPCAQSDPAYCIPVIPPLIVDNTAAMPGADIDKGGGSLYQIEAYRWQPPTATVALIVIRGTGYHGNNPAVDVTATRMSSMVIVEVSEGTPNKGGCTGYCGAGLD